MPEFFVAAVCGPLSTITERCN